MTTIPIALEKLLTGQLRFMNQFYEVIGIASEPHHLHRVEKQEGIKTWPLLMTRKITPVQDLRAVARLYAHLKKEKPFIVHTHTPKAGIVGMLASKLAGVPNRLHTVAGLPLLEAVGTKRKVLDFVEKFTYSCATKVYPNSFEMAKIILQNGYCKPEKLKVLGNGSSNGIDTDHFSPDHFSPEENAKLRQELGIAPGDFVFVFVGRMVRDKGIEELIGAFKKVNNQNPDVKLLLVGDYEPDLDPISPETVHEINANPAIVTTGWKTDVRPYFAISQVLAFPSYREGFPNVVMQAGAMGLPSIVTNINGCNEIIQHNVNGIIVEPKDETGLYNEMLVMYTGESQFLSLQENARKNIVSRFSQKELWNALLAEYRALEK